MRLRPIDRFKSIFIILSFFVLTNCTLSLKAPPITFTQTQTASEKQMVGEDQEIERDGWLISSIKSSSSGSEMWKKNAVIGESKNKNFIILQKKLTYHEPELRIYKSRGIVGESFDGNIKFVPKNSLKNPEELNRLRELVSQINSTREEAMKIQLEENPTLTREVLLESHVQVRFQYLEYGEFFEPLKNKWEKKE